MADMIDDKISTLIWEAQKSCPTGKEKSLKAHGSDYCYKKGDFIGSWEIIYYGSYGNRPAAILENMRDCSLRIIRDTDDYILFKKCSHDTTDSTDKSETEYFGLELKDVINSGVDILGKKVLENGEPSYEAIKHILPPVKKGAYTYISGVSSWHGVLIMPDGSIIPQEAGNNPKPTPIFSPVELDDALGNVTPKQYLINGWIPVLISVFEMGNEVLEIMYFVEPGNTDKDPLVWTRAQKYNSDNGIRSFDEFYIISQSLTNIRRQTGSEIFWDAFLTGITFWRDFEKELCQFNVPDIVLSKCLKGTMAAFLTTFSSDHAHYGHKGYGWEYHDNFPPIYLTAIETCHAMGMSLRARRYAEHVLAYCIDSVGRFVYRQGCKRIYGASGTEYGQWLWLVNRLEAVLNPKGWLEPYIDKLAATGNYLLQSRAEIPECNGRRLISMCAEADNNSKIYAYVSNNLWAILGLRSLGALLVRYGRKESQYFLEEANNLEFEHSKALEEASVNTRFGRLVPFRFGYTATPLTLSSCREPFYPVEESVLSEYLNSKEIYNSNNSKQDLTENTYANYRYYPEMLSTMLLSKDVSDALVEMRENLGGECLGMTRFFRYIDDWPAANYARFLLSTDRLDKYLLLLYSHMAHHGNPDLMVYYEQVTADGSVNAPDCVPSTLLVAVMTAWMFCFEPLHENSVYLLRGIPSKWFECENDFGADKIGSTFGNINIQVKSGLELIEVAVTLPQKYDGRPVYIDFRLPCELKLQDIFTGREYVKSIIKGNRIRLKKDIKGTINLSFRK